MLVSRNHLRVLSLVAATDLISACAPDRKSGGEFGTSASGSASGPGGSAGSSTGSTGGDGDGSDGSGSDSGDDDGSGGGAIRFDVDEDDRETAGDGSEGGGCEKIDFLFVIDNSGSMEDEQINLVNSFPSFIGTIETATDTSDFQILVVDTDECDPTAGQGSSISGTVDCDAYCPQNPAATCNGMYCGGCPFSGCDNDIGSGKIHDRMGQPCPMAAGTRYLLSTEPDLAGSFACLAEVGIDGSGNERPMEAMTTALGPLTDMGGCNAGFLRDDALLVVVIITDEEDDLEGGGFGSPGAPAQWFDAIVAAKRGVERNAVILSIVGPDMPAMDVCPPLDKGGDAVNGAEVATRILEFTRLFTWGFVGPVCAASYEPFFNEAVSVVDVACDEFVPPG